MSDPIIEKSSPITENGSNQMDSIKNHPNVDKNE